MNSLETITGALVSIIPKYQMEATMEALEAHTPALKHLETLLEKCPKIGETNGMKEHPAIFHYFFGGSDFYVCEYDPDDGLMFGYGILNGDLQNSEWGYFSVFEFAASKYLNIDYHFEEQSIEAAIYKAYPKHFKKPQSLEAGKNDPLPDTYSNFPYQYKKGSLGTVLQKNHEEVYLYGDDETKFFQDCNRAKQHSRNLTDVIEEYFIN